MPPLGLDFVKLGLQDVLYYPDKDGMTFVPNMNAVGGIKLAMEDREEAKKQKEAELEAEKKKAEASAVEIVGNEQKPSENVQDTSKNDANEEGGEDDADRDQE